MKNTMMAGFGALVLCVVIGIVYLRATREEDAHIDAKEAARNAVLVDRIEGLEGALDSALSDVSRLEQALEDAAAVRESLANRVAGLEASRGPASGAATTPVDASGDTTAADLALASDSTEPEFDFDETIERIIAREGGVGASQGLWKAIVDAGRIDDALAILAERAKLNPDDANSQADYGHACIQKLLEVKDLEKMQWSMKATSAYDRALALDETHWDSRFSKAMNYAFTPPVFGLQSKAIDEFEILRAQQENVPVESHFAETYEVLGNLYDSKGEKGKAQEVWRRGAELFPENRALGGRVTATDATGEAR